MAVPSSTVRTTAQPSAPRRPARRPAGRAPETSARANSVPRRVAILVYDGVTLLDVAGPAEVFKEANRFGADYRIVLLSPTGEDIRSNLGFGVAVDGAVYSERAPDTISGGRPGSRQGRLKSISADRPIPPVPSQLLESWKVSASPALESQPSPSLRSLATVKRPTALSRVRAGELC
jgi:hypothetical protein